MAEINTEKKEKEYKDEYVIINLETEYHGYTGDIPYAIVTDLSEKEFLANFGEETKSFRPCIFLTGKMYSAFLDYDKNEHREHTREGDYHDAFAFESSALLLVDEMANPARICESKFTLACIFKKLRALPDNEGSRIYKRYVIGYTAREIAQQEGVSHWSVRASIVRAKPKVHDIFVELGVAA